jgi:hypothetical protein
MFITCFFCSMAVPKEDSKYGCCSTCSQRAEKVFEKRDYAAFPSQVQREPTEKVVFPEDDIEKENWKKDIVQDAEFEKTGSMIGVDDFNVYHPMPKARRA